MKHRAHWPLVLLAVMASLQSFAQRENNIWEFGNRCSLNFNNGTPLFVLSNMATTEGCASICDSAGNLLFYSNGYTVWNKNDQVMPNSTGLLGNKLGSATQGVAIVRSMSNTQQYYLFVLDAEEQVIATPPLPHGGYLRYSVIDMTLNKGLGDVVTGKKNVLLDSNMSEKMVVVAGAGCSCWLLTHDRGLAQYRAHKIDVNGIDGNTVISNTGIPIPPAYQSFPGPYMRGEMMVSPDRTKVALVNTIAPVTELADFDYTSGIVSNTISLDSTAGTLNYGIHFSPQGSKLYTSQLSPGQITQYDLDLLPNLTAAKNTKTIIATGNFGGFRTAPDNKIYVLKHVGQTPYIAFIDNPDLPGKACNLTLGNIILTGNNDGLLSLGNPSVALPVASSAASYDTIACGQASATIHAPAGYDTYLWSNGSAQQSITVNNSITCWVKASAGCRTTSDTFRVATGHIDTTISKTDTAVCFTPAVALMLPAGCRSYAWSDGSTGQTDMARQTALYWCMAVQGCHSIFDTFQVRITNFSAFIGNDTAICPGDTLLLSLDVAEATYLWNNGRETPSFTVPGPGKYAVTVHKDYCTASDTIDVREKKLVVWLGNDTTVCNGVALTLDAGIEGHYLWQNGSTAKDMMVTTPGYYGVKVSQGNCFAADTMQVVYRPCMCPALIPNAFTPNHDGKNDVFSAEVQCPYKEYWLKVYNRWGQVVFNSFSTSNKWDGTFNGTMADTGVYYYTLQITGPDGAPYFYKGDVTLIR